MSDNQNPNGELFDSEHAKRDKRITDLQRRTWADGLIARLPDSLAFRKHCTPQARLHEQEVLLQLIDQWKIQQIAVASESNAAVNQNAENRKAR